MNFKHLVSIIDKTHHVLQKQATKAININLSLRNWLFGFYIVEFEQNGEDRAKYGDKLISNLSKKLTEKKVPTVQPRELRRYRLFYKRYYHFASVFDTKTLPVAIRETLSPELQNTDY